MNSGLRTPRFRPGHRFLPEAGRLGRWALAGALALPVFTAILAISGATVLLELVAPTKDQETRAFDLPAWDDPPAGGMTQVRARAMDFVAVPPAQVPPAVVPPAVEIERASAIIPIPESELTFAKGYAARRAAREAAAKLETMSKTAVESGVAVESGAVAESGAVVKMGLGIAPHLTQYRHPQRDKRPFARSAVRLMDRHNGYGVPSDDHPGRRIYGGRENQSRRMTVRDRWRDRNLFGQSYQRMATLDDHVEHAWQARARDTDLFSAVRREPDRGSRQERKRSTPWH